MLLRREPHLARIHAILRNAIHAGQAKHLQLENKAMPSTVFDYATHKVLSGPTRLAASLLYPAKTEVLMRVAGIFLST